MNAEFLRGLVEHAALAPSSHNTQPWRFRIADDRLELYADRTRALPVNDPHDRELTISCGAALLNTRIAAQHAGAHLQVALALEGDLLATATLAGTAEPEERLFAAIPERRTYRQAFTDRDVATDELAAAAATEGAWLELLDAERRAQFAALVGEGDRLQFADKRWRRELASWMRPRGAHDGLAMPTPARFVVKYVDVGRRTARQDVELAERAPVLALLATAGDTRADWLRAGQALQRLLLTAAAAGVHGGFLNQPLQVERLRPNANALLSRPGFAQVAVRLGHPRRTLPPARRRPVEVLLD